VALSRALDSGGGSSTVRPSYLLILRLPPLSPLAQLYSRSFGLPVNLPLSGIAMLLVALFLDVKATQTTRQEKLDQVDYANLLAVAFSTATILTTLE
jgi:hypothetical protein